MKRSFLSLAALSLSSLILSGSALASPATDELSAGHYARAYDLAQQSGDLPTASSAALAAITFTPSPDSAAIDRALKAAQAAVQANPNSGQAHLDLAGAYGLRANTSGLSPAAYRLARDARGEIERAVALDPHSARALAALARWHAGAYARAGRLSGGNPDTARKLATQALAGAANDIAVYVNVATALSDLKDSRSARTVLDRALSLTPQNAVERDYQAQGKALLTKLK